MIIRLYIDGCSTTLFELEKRCRSHLERTNDSWRVDETYIKVKGKWKYLYRAVDSAGNTIEFMLSAKRDKRAAKRFFHKALKASKNQSPRVINVDKNAAYPPAVEELKTEEILSQRSDLRQNKYLNNLVEQDHRFIKKLVNPGLGFQSFYTARRTIIGYETMNQIRKGRSSRSSFMRHPSSSRIRVSNFWSCCITRVNCQNCFVLKKFLQHNPSAKVTCSIGLSTQAKNFLALER